MEKKVQPALLAGSWYPGSRAALSEALAAYAADAKPAPAAAVMALVLPHAGYRYSGATAAWGAALVRGKAYDRVVLLGPTHHVAMTNTVSVPAVTHLATPLGEIPLDLDFIARLRQLPQVKSLPAAHTREHCLEIELPFLQDALGAFKAVPIIVGQLDAATEAALAAGLRPLLDAKTLVVISSDFTHYGPNYGYVPFRDNVPRELEKLDLGAFAKIQARDAKGFRAYCEDTGATICGADPIGVLLELLPPTAEVRLLKYDTSGRVTDDYENSVSYLSIACLGTWGARATATAGAGAASVGPEALTADDKMRLLWLARQTLNYYFARKARPSAEDLAFTPTPAMAAAAGVFVTLREPGGELRGCIGNTTGRQALWLGIMEYALHSALDDPRFAPVTGSEVPKLKLEISVLTAPRPVASWRDIEIGKHGMVLKKNGRSALFLPQVATEQGWDLATTLSYLARKAGLAPDAWQEGAAFEVFEAIVFGEAH